MNSTRRQSMKKDLHRDYAALCNATTVPSSSEFLFGDLSKLTKDISDANKLTKKVRPASHSSTRGRKSTFTNHYSANRNRRFAPYAYSRARYNDNNNFLSKSRSPPMKGKKESITKPNNAAAAVPITKFTPDSRICPLTTQKAYMKKTETLRNGENKLFISFIKPNKAVSRDTISRWTKQVLTNSGIDTKIFTSHSTRAASATKA
ncbi:unnamed protein product, partial [Porites lobata]